MIYWCLCVKSNFKTVTNPILCITKSDFYLFLWLHFLLYSVSFFFVAWYLFCHWFLSFGWDWNTKFYFTFFLLQSFVTLWFRFDGKKMNVIDKHLPHCLTKSNVFAHHSTVKWHVITKLTCIASPPILKCRTSKIICSFTIAKFLIFPFRQHWLRCLCGNNAWW